MARVYSTGNVPITAYSRVKLFWGAFDVEHSDEAAYSPAQTKPMGESAVPPGIGVRRCSLRFTRAGLGTGEDVLTTYFDFQNFTTGEPDDSWTDTDFSTLEGYVDTFWNAIKLYAYNKVVLAEYRWYRIGPGVTPPNPPARITPRNIPGSSTSSMAPQIAISLTKKTAARRQWGRNYLPLGDPNTLQSTGFIDPAKCTTIVTAAHTMLSAASAADFLPVIYSPTRQKAYSVEKLQVDDIADVVRSRRYDKPTTRAVKP